MDGHIDIDWAVGGKFGEQESLFKKQERDTTILGAIFRKKGMTRVNLLLVAYWWLRTIVPGDKTF